MTDPTPRRKPHRLTASASRTSCARGNEAGVKARALNDQPNADRLKLKRYTFEDGQ